MGAKALGVKLDSMKKLEAGLFTQFKSLIELNFLSPFPLNAFTPVGSNTNINYRYMHYKDRLNGAKGSINSRIEQFSNFYSDMNNFSVEIHKKYSLPIACIIFVLIGAPLGTMTRRGGFGVAAGISLTFFLIYWACLIGGEKLAIRGYLSPFLAMWGANFIMGSFGLFILYKSAKEKIELNFDWMKKLLPKQLRIFQEQNENN
jgi:lipopolysaccharide export system permease protein